MARAFSGKLFDRNGNTDCFRKFASDLAELAVDLFPNRRAQGVNLEIDWRVSGERERRFCSWCKLSNPDESKPNDVRALLVEFFHKEIRGVNSPDFLWPHNKLNRRNDIERNTTLVNAFLFPQTPEVIQRGAISIGRSGLLTQGESVAMLEEVFPPEEAASSWNEASGLDDTQRGFVAACFSGRAKPNFHPVWAGLWDGFDSFFGLGPDFWLSALGVRSSRRRLCLLFRYSLSSLKGAPLFVPTSLEANLCPEHFPSPPPRCSWKGDLLAPMGGHPVSLHATTDGGRLLQEFVHEDFRREPDMVCAWGWTSDDSPCKPLERARAEHRSRLGISYQGVEDWVPEPI